MIKETRDEGRTLAQQEGVDERGEEREFGR